MLEIKCSGGLALACDGSFSFYVELELQGDTFTYESLSTFPTEEEAESQATLCCSAFPEVISQAARERKFELVESYCEKWNLIKVESPKKKTDEEKPEGPLH